MAFLQRIVPVTNQACNCLKPSQRKRSSEGSDAKLRPWRPELSGAGELATAQPGWTQVRSRWGPVFFGALDILSEHLCDQEAVSLTRYFSVAKTTEGLTTVDFLLQWRETCMDPLIKDLQQQGPF